MSYQRIDLSRYIVVSVCFSCNNDCLICMLSGLKDRLPGIDFENFKRVITAIEEDGRFRNLILSGAEVTTFDELEMYIQFASSLGWFRKIQLQTNGRRLSDKGYLRHLIDLGVNEFFLSIHGREEIHDAITRRTGSFRETMAALRNLEALDVNVITNTVLTKANFYDVLPLMGQLTQGEVSELHLWNFFPMERRDSRDLVVSLRSLLALLPSLLAVVRAAERPLVLKSFPECLSTGEPAFLDSRFPVTVLPDLFWKKFGDSGFGSCIYRDRGECRSKSCWGLSRAYLDKYGEEADLLRPIASPADLSPRGEGKEGGLF